MGSKRRVALDSCTANTHLRIYYATGTRALQRASFSFVTAMGDSAEFSPGHCWATASKPQSLESPFTFRLQCTAKQAVCSLNYHYWL